MNARRTPATLISVVFFVLLLAPLSHCLASAGIREDAWCRDKASFVRWSDPGPGNAFLAFGIATDRSTLIEVRLGVSGISLRIGAADEQPTGEKTAVFQVPATDRRP